MIISRRLAALAALVGAAAWVVFFSADLVLTHYDAKAHLVVARRVIDNITPGWQQIGAVWLPLPHLLQLVPTQVDLLYRTGIFGSLLSVGCFTATAYAAARLAVGMTGSAAAAVTAVGLLVVNPNLLYLQATPMTEPLLLAVTFLAVLWIYEWTLEDAATPVPARLHAVLFAAAWTRYEAWLVIAAALMAAWSAAGFRRAWRLGIAPAAAVAIFLVNSRITVGSWFVSGGFYVRDPTYDGLPWKTLVSLWWGTHEMSGYVVEIAALIAAALVAAIALSRATRRAWLIPVALFAAGALPFYAFVSGHPYRIRYMIPLVAACALFAGLGVGLVRTRALRTALPGLLIASLALESPLWTGTAPLIVEAQWDVPASLNRRAVTACLAGQYRGEKVLASMGSLAHYMQELSHAGFDIADFVNEGNGAIWELAMRTGPALHAGWMLVEEQAEGGDALSQAMIENPRFADGMDRVCEGGGVALYKRSSDYGLRSSVTP